MASPAALDEVFRAIALYRADTPLLISDAMLFETRDRIVAFALQERLPTVALSPEQTAPEMLFALGASRVEMYRRPAIYVKKILAGAQTG